MRPLAFIASFIASLALALAGAPTGFAEERQGGQVVMRMVSVTGALGRDPSGALEIASDLGGRYRIDPHGAGDALGAHVGEHVTVVATVDRPQEQLLPLLHVERFTAHER
jgi:hypothetical protein